MPANHFYFISFKDPMIFFNVSERFAWPVSLSSYCLLPHKKQGSKKHQYYILSTIIYLAGLDSRMIPPTLRHG